MREHNYRKTIVVHATTPHEFEELLNEAYEKASSNLLDVHYNDGAGMCAYITYEVCEKIPENFRDEAILRGERFHCFDCPYLELPEDKRKKWCDCRYSPDGYTHKNAHACEYFYKALAQGRIKLNRGEEDED